MADDEDTFEPKRRFRWVAEIGGISPFKLISMRFAKAELSSLFGDTLQIDYSLTEQDDILCPVERSGAGTLKFLDKDGSVTDAYEVRWDGMRHWPFLDLDYRSGEGVVGRVVLSSVSFQKV